MPKVKVNCENCDKPVMKWPRDIRDSTHHFCSQECHYEWRRKQDYKPATFKENYLICDNCGKRFHRAPSDVTDSEHHFCSKKCMTDFHWKTLTCDECGKTFRRRKSRIKSGATFCSKNCQQKWVGRLNTRDLEDRVCPICGSHFQVKPFDDKKFCSRKCMGRWMSKTRKGEDNPFWKPKIEKKCEICGKNFEVFPSNSGRRFCSQECQVVWIKERGITPSNRKKMLKALLKRPTKPEQKVIDIIEEHNFPFKYVGDGSFILGGLNPDFVNKEDKQIIEVFGDYWHNPDNCPRTSLASVRAAIFGSLHYKLLIIWEHETDNRQDVVERINSFVLGD